MTSDHKSHHSLSILNIRIYWNKHIKNNTYFTSMPTRVQGKCLSQVLLWYCQQWSYHWHSAWRLTERFDEDENDVNRMQWPSVTGSQPSWTPGRLWTYVWDSVLHTYPHPQHQKEIYFGRGVFHPSCRVHTLGESMPRCTEAVQHLLTLTNTLLKQEQGSYPWKLCSDIYSDNIFPIYSPNLVELRHLGSLVNTNPI